VAVDWPLVQLVLEIVPVVDFLRVVVGVLVVLGWGLELLVLAVMLMVGFPLVVVPVV
jgi:hypothetical protein